METIDSVRPICNISIMSDHHDSVTYLLVECIDEIHDASSVALIEITSRLICEEIRHISYKGSSNGYSLLLPSREFCGIAISLATESDFLEDHTRLIATRSMGDIENKIDILFNSQIGDELERLEDECDMLSTILDHPIDTQLCDIGMTELYSTTIRRDNPSDE